MNEINILDLLNQLGVSDKWTSSRVKPLIESLKLTSINSKELDLLLRILEEMAHSPQGVSNTYSALLAEDFIEVPVSMKRFIEDEDYLGSFCKTLYPFWKNILIDIVDNDKGYLEVALSGAIGIGKTHIGVILMLRCLYYLLCLRDPHKYLGVSQTIALVFLNLNLDLAEGVGFDRFNKGAMSSPWFKRHGSIEGRKYKIYKPDKDVSALIASTNDHMVGKDVFCVSGDTLIATDQGLIDIESLSKMDISNIKVLGYYLNDNTFKYSKFEGVTKTSSTRSYEFKFDSGDKVEVSPDHKFLTEYGFITATELHELFTSKGVPIKIIKYNTGGTRDE